MNVRDERLQKREEERRTRRVAVGKHIAGAPTSVADRNAEREAYLTQVERQRTQPMQHEPVASAPPKHSGPTGLDHNVQRARQEHTRQHDVWEAKKQQFMMTQNGNGGTPPHQEQSSPRTQRSNNVGNETMSSGYFPDGTPQNGFQQNQPRQQMAQANYYRPAEAPQISHHSANQNGAPNQMTQQHYYQPEAQQNSHRPQPQHPQQTHQQHQQQPPTPRDNAYAEAPQTARRKQVLSPQEYAQELKLQMEYKKRQESKINQNNASAPRRETKSSHAADTARNRVLAQQEYAHELQQQIEFKNQQKNVHQQNSYRAPPLSEQADSRRLSRLSKEEYARELQVQVDYKKMAQQRRPTPNGWTASALESNPISPGKQNVHAHEVRAREQQRRKQEAYSRELEQQVQNHEARKYQARQMSLELDKRSLQQYEIAPGPDPQGYKSPMPQNATFPPHFQTQQGPVSEMHQPYQPPQQMSPGPEIYPDYNPPAQPPSVNGFSSNRRIRADLHGQLNNQEEKNQRTQKQQINNYLHQQMEEKKQKAAEDKRKQHEEDRLELARIERDKETLRLNYEKEQQEKREKAIQSEARDMENRMAAQQRAKDAAQEKSDKRNYRSNSSVAIPESYLRSNSSVSVPEAPPLSQISEVASTTQYPTNPPMQEMHNFNQNHSNMHNPSRSHSVQVNENHSDMHNPNRSHSMQLNENPLNVQYDQTPFNIQSMHPTLNQSSGHNSRLNSIASIPESNYRSNSVTSIPEVPIRQEMQEMHNSNLHNPSRSHSMQLNHSNIQAMHLNERQLPHPPQTDQLQELVSEMRLRDDRARATDMDHIRHEMNEKLHQQGRKYQEDLDLVKNQWESAERAKKLQVHQDKMRIPPAPMRSSPHESFLNFTEPHLKTGSSWDVPFEPNQTHSSPTHNTRDSQRSKWSFQHEPEEQDKGSLVCKTEFIDVDEEGRSPIRKTSPISRSSPSRTEVQSCSSPKLKKYSALEVPEIEEGRVSAPLTISVDSKVHDSISPRFAAPRHEEEESSPNQRYSVRDSDNWNIDDIYAKAQSREQLLNVSSYTEMY